LADSYSVYLGRRLWPPWSTSRRGLWEKVPWATPTRDADMHWAIVAHISPKNGRIHHSKFPSAGNVHGNKNYAFSQCKSCLHIADFHQPSSAACGLAPGTHSRPPEPFCHAEWLNEEPDMGKPFVRFCEGLRYNWCMGEILWHRRETRRQTENTNVTPTAPEDLSLLDNKSAVPSPLKLLRSGVYWTA